MTIAVTKRREVKAPAETALVYRLQPENTKPRFSFQNLCQN